MKKCLSAIHVFSCLLLISVLLLVITILITYNILNCWSIRICPLFASSVYTAACYLKMYVVADRRPPLRSIRLCLVFFPSPLCARLASPRVSVQLKVSSRRSGWRGESMKTFECFLLLDIFGSSASHWALNREAAQGFFFFITFLAKPPLPLFTIW